MFGIFQALREAQPLAASLQRALGGELGLFPSCPPEVSGCCLEALAERGQEVTKYQGKPETFQSQGLLQKVQSGCSQQKIKSKLNQARPVQTVDCNQLVTCAK